MILRKSNRFFHYFIFRKFAYNLIIITKQIVTLNLYIQKMYFACLYQPVIKNIIVYITLCNLLSMCIMYILLFTHIK